MIRSIRRLDEDELKLCTVVTGDEHESVGSSRVLNGFNAEHSYMKFNNTFYYNDGEDDFPNLVILKIPDSIVDDVNGL